MDSEIAVIAFASNGTGNPDAFVVTNINREPQKVAVKVSGTQAKVFEAFRTTKSPGAEDADHIDEAYAPLGEFRLKDGMIICDCPAGSVTTFFAGR